MNAIPVESNPFALLLAPEAVIAKVLNSKRLAMLDSRVCRPLDKPVLGRDQPDAPAADDALDALIERDD